MNTNSLLDDLFNIGAIQFRTDPLFTYSSGLKGPIYCDNRLLLTHLATREKVLEGLQQILLSLGPNTIKDAAIVGLATSGLAFGAMLAEKMKMPLAYHRSQKKNYGGEKLLEGDISTLKDVVLVEDLINQGKSTFAALSACRQVGLNPIAILCVVDYGFIEVGSGSLPPIFSLIKRSQIVLDIRERWGEKAAHRVNEWFASPATFNH